MHCEDAVLVAGEVGELPHVVPHPLVGRVEQVRPVLVDLDTGLRFSFRVGVAAQMGRRSITRTRLPSCVAARSAIVSPKNPEPTMNKSKWPLDWSVATRGDKDVIGSQGIRPRPCAPNSARAQVAIRSRFNIVTSDTPVTALTSISSAFMDFTPTGPEYRRSKRRASTCNPQCSPWLQTY